MRYLIPRVDAGPARLRLEELETALEEGKDLSKLVQVDVGEAVPNATGGASPSASVIWSWRDQITDRLTAVSGTGKAFNDDHAIRLGRALAEIVDPIPSDVAHDGTWRYLALYVFPDVVAQRWSPELDSAGRLRLSRDRWIGRPEGRDRNYLKTSWLRWTVLGDALLTADPPLGEDELVQLVERTATARNSRLVRAVARVVGSYDGAWGRMDFTRELMKKISYQTGSRSLDVLSDEEIDAFVAECVDSL